MKKSPKDVLGRYTMRNEQQWRKFLSNPDNVEILIQDIRDIENLIRHYDNLLMEAAIREEHDRMILQDLQNKLDAFRIQHEKELKEAIYDEKIE